MSDTQTKRRVATPEGRRFLIDTGIARGLVRKAPDRAAYSAASAQAQPTLAAADQILAAPALLPEVVAVHGNYTTTGAQEARAVQSGDWVQAQQALQQRVTAAQAVVAAKATGERNVYRAAAAKAQPRIDAAERILAITPLPREVAATQQQYATAKANVTAAVQGGQFVQALQAVPAHQAAAEAVLLGKAQADASFAKKKQLANQIGVYNEMAPILGDVKRINLPQGMAKNLKENNQDAGKEFKTFLAKLQGLEDAKSPVDPAQPVDAARAGAIKGACKQVIDAAQAYLAHYEKDLSDKQKAGKGSLSRKHHCEEAIKSASQYALAMEIDIAGRPSQNAPWNRETEMRVAGARFAFGYEQGNKKLQGLNDDGGGKGASDSYWARSKSIAEVGEELRTGSEAKGARTYIFKPAQGENNPDGMNAEKGAGAAKEALASSNAKLFARQTGIDLGVPDTTVVSMGQYALRGGDLAGPALVGSAQQLAAGTSTELRGLPSDAFNKVQPKQVQKIALLDIMSLSMDRHGGNLMVDTADPNDPKLVPIDHGGTLPSRADFPDAKSRLGGLITSNFQNSTAPVNALLQIPSAFEPFDPEILAGIDLLDPAAIEADMQAQLTAMDQVHPALGATQKVGADSLHMSKRSMMFLKKAAKTMSPAEIQIALAQHGEALFDATDANFDGVADQVIADMAPKKDALREIMGLSENQRFEVTEFLVANQWVQTQVQAKEMLMSEPRSALDLFKSKSANQAALPESPFKRPKLPQGQTATQADIDLAKAMFPNGTGLDKASSADEQVAAYREFVQNGWTAADLTQVVQAVGGNAPNNPGPALAVMKAWTELQKPAFQQELARLPLDPAKTCYDNLDELMKQKIPQIAMAQMGASAAAAAGALDPATTASGYAQDLLANAKTSLDAFVDPANAAALLAQWQRLTAKQAQGAAPNQSALDFAKEIEADATTLVQAVTAAGLDDVRGAYAALARDFQGLKAPDDVSNLENQYFQGMEGINLSLGGAGNLKIARDTLRNLEAGKQAMLARAVPIAAPVQPNPAAAAQQAQPQAAAQPLGTFDWDQAISSTVKRQAVQLRLFKDKDTGMSDALKAVNKARAAAGNIAAALPKAKKIAIYTQAEAACAEFNKFVNGKLRGLSKDPRWGGYCDSAADKAQGELAKFKALRVALG